MADKTIKIKGDIRGITSGKVISCCFGGKYDGENEVREGETILYVSVPDNIAVNSKMYAMIFEIGFKKEKE